MTFRTFARIIAKVKDGTYTAPEHIVTEVLLDQEVALRNKERLAKCPAGCHCDSCCSRR